MSVFQTVALLLTLAALGAYINNRFLKLPATIGLMVFALLMSLSAIGLNYCSLIDLRAASAFVNQIDFSDVLLHGMLSFLLFAGALHINISDLKKYRVVVATLATVGVILATIVTGTLVWWAAQHIGAHLNYIYALVFGALIAPTDPVAVLSILKEIEMPKSFRVKIGGESLFNDGIGVVIFLVLLGIAEAPSPVVLAPSHIVALLMWEGLGSIILGLTLGWITYRLLLPIDDYKTEIMLTLALATGGYSLAESIGVSAPITMVVAGLFIGNHGRVFGMSDKTRLHLDMFWELLDEILNAVLFVLIGLEMMVITLNRADFAMGLVAVLAMLSGRFISVYIPISIMKINHRFERGTIPILTWGGLRGGISIAMALSLPAGPEKELILGMTYIVVIFSVLFQGTTFRHFAKAIMNKKA